MARSPKNASLGLRMFALALALRPLKHVMPLASLVRLMSTTPRRAESSERLQTIATLARRVPALRPISNRHNCLESSLVAYRYLARAGAQPVLVTGVLRDADSGHLRGHCWVEVAGRPVADDESGDRAFTTLAVFGPDGRLLGAPNAAGRPA